MIRREPARVVEDVVSLASALRREGIGLDTTRVEAAIRALAEMGISDAPTTFWVLRCVLTQRREDVVIFDRVAQAMAVPPTSEEAPGEVLEEPSAAGLMDAGRPLEQQSPDQEQGVAWSAEERLRRLDFSRYGDDEMRRARELVAKLSASLPQRASRRLQRSRKRRYFDPRRTVRAAGRTHGLPLSLVWTEQGERPRKLLLAVDVSGSMQTASRVVLMFVQAAVRVGSRVEAFAFSTRLTRLTPYLRSRELNSALARATGEVRDWGGGTRIADSLRVLNATWGPRGALRGAVVVIVSDGLEHGSPELLAEQMARIHRDAHAVVWVNPLAGDADYQPLAAGMAAAMPYIDYFLPGNDLNALFELTGVLAHIPQSRARIHRGRAART